jgi:hypothetical protein
MKFLFSKSTHKLVMVVLRRDAEKPSEYEQVLAALTDKYGPPLRGKNLTEASVDTSSPEQEANTRIGSGSAVGCRAQPRSNSLTLRHLAIEFSQWGTSRAAKNEIYKLLSLIGG